jgi:DNA replication and repair protein RecF
MLLLDDIFDKLDSSRVECIMQTVSSSDEFGQIFITDTNREHLDEILNHIDGHLLMDVKDGTFTPISNSQTK